MRGIHLHIPSIISKTKVLEEDFLPNVEHIRWYSERDPEDVDRNLRYVNDWWNNLEMAHHRWDDEEFQDMIQVHRLQLQAIHSVSVCQFDWYISSNDSLPLVR